MKINIKCITEDGIGITYLEPESIELEDDGSATIIIKAWPELHTSEDLHNHNCQITADCSYYSYQTDRNGDVVICFCSHPDNKNQYEGNCTHSLCPLIGEMQEDFS